MCVSAGTAVYSCTHIKIIFLMWYISLHWLVEVSTFFPHLKHLPCQFLWPLGDHPMPEVWCGVKPGCGCIPCTNQVRLFQFPSSPCPVISQWIGACVEIPPWKTDQALEWWWALKFRLFLCPRFLAVMGSVRSCCTDISISSPPPFVLSMALNWISGLQLASSWGCRKVGITINTWLLYGVSPAALQWGYL